MATGSSCTRTGYCIYLSQFARSSLVNRVRSLNITILMLKHRCGDRSLLFKNYFWLERRDEKQRKPKDRHKTDTFGTLSERKCAVCVSVSVYGPSRNWNDSVFPQGHRLCIFINTPHTHTHTCSHSLSFSICMSNTMQSQRAD